MGVNNIVFSPAMIYTGKRPEGTHKYDVVPVAYQQQQKNVVNPNISNGQGGQQQFNNHNSNQPV